MVNNASFHSSVLSSILDSSGISVILREKNGVITCWSKGAQELYGYSESEVLGKNFSLLYPKDVNEKERLFCMEVLSSKKTLNNYEKKYLRKDGSEIEVTITLSPIIDDNGQIIGLTEVAKERPPDALLNEQFRLAQENSPIGKVMIDSKGDIVFVNKAIEKIFQYTKEELMGRKIEIFVPQRAKGEHKKYRNEYTKKPANRAMGADRLLYGVRKDGEEIPVEIGLTPFTTSQGSFVIAAIVDITERQKLAGAVRSNRELEQFAYIASHDLQAPLRHIASYIDFLAEKNESIHDEESKEWIRVILKGVKRMRLLINDLLKYSRVSRCELKFENQVLEGILDEVLEILSDRIKETHTTITQDHLPRIRCIPNLMSDVFQNLIENAIKFQEEDSPPKIHISVVSDEDFWTISVKDNGIGVDNRYLERIFAPFQRLHKPSEKPGTGIGLAIVKKIVEVHKGKVWAESTKGKGSTFYFTIAKKS